MHPNRQFLAHFVVHMPWGLHVLFRVARSCVLCIVIGGVREPSLRVGSLGAGIPLHPGTYYARGVVVRGEEGQWSPQTLEGGGSLKGAQLTRAIISHDAEGAPNSLEGQHLLQHTLGQTPPQGETPPLDTHQTHTQGSISH